MSSQVQDIHTISYWLLNRPWIGAVTLTLMIWFSLGGAAIAQDVQYTQNTADQRCAATSRLIQRLWG
jgi:hypothetical protein